MAAPGGEWSNLREVTVWTADGSARMRRVAAALGRLESAPLRTDHRGAANPDPEQTKPINRSAFLSPVVYLERQGASGPVRIELRPGQRWIVYRALRSAGFAFDGEG